MSGWEAFGWFVLVVTAGFVLTVLTWRFEQWLRRVLITAQRNHVTRMVRAEEALFLPFADTGLRPDARTPLYDSVTVDLARERRRRRNVTA